jgi:hypothetical protein
MIGAAALGVMALAALGSGAGHALRHGAVRVLATALPGTAHAQQVLEFKPVSPESADALERRAQERAQAIVDRATRRAEARARAARPPEPPGAPDNPVPPEPPNPDEDLGRSGDIMRLGSDVVVDANQVVDGDVVAIGGDVEVLGHVRGDAAAMGGDLHLGPDGRVDGDVVCIGGRLTEDPGASVGGQRVTALGVMKGHAGRGYVPRHHVDLGDFEPMVRAGRVISSIVLLVIMLIFAWGYVTFVPERTAVAVATIKREGGMSLLAGFLTAVMLVPSLVALALVMAILCITIIGIPLAIAALFAYFALVLVLLTWGLVAGAVVLGERLAARGQATIGFMQAALIGILAMEGLRVVGAVIQIFPFVGWVGGLLRFIGIVAESLAILVGAGALLRSKFGQGPEGKWWPLRRPATPAAGGTAAPPPAPAPPVAPGPGAAEAAPPGGGAV